MCFDEGIDFGIDGSLQHPAGSLTENLIEWAAVIELPPKGEHFEIDLFIHWNVVSACRSLVHGVSLCPCRAAEVVKYLSRIRRFSPTLQEHNF